MHTHRPWYIGKQSRCPSTWSSCTQTWSCNLLMLVDVVLPTHGGIFLTSIVMPSPQVPPFEAWAFFDGSQDLSSTYISLLVGLDFSLTLLSWCLVPPACCFLPLFIISMLCSYLLQHLNVLSWRWQVVVAHILLRTVSSHRACNFGGVALPWHWLPFHHTL